MLGTPWSHGFPVLAELCEDNARDDEEQPTTENRECAAPDPPRRGGGVADEAGTAQAFGQPGPHDRPPLGHCRLFAFETVLYHGIELGTVTIAPAGGIPPEHGPAHRVLFLRMSPVLMPGSRRFSEPAGVRSLGSPQPVGGRPRQPSVACCPPLQRGRRILPPRSDKDADGHRTRAARSDLAPPIGGWPPKGRRVPEPPRQILRCPWIGHARVWGRRPGW